MDYAQALAALDARTNYEATGRLTAPTRERIEALLDILDHPQRGIPAIHVTGTAGKTTVTLIAAALLRALGLPAGAYTSPHLETIRERIRFEGESISEEDFAATMAYLSPFLDTVDGASDRPLTWFETLTAAAFTWLADRAPAALAVEVGMGGTWDATNVLDAAVAVVTDVGLDHPELGTTPAEVAREKAGIIAPGAIAITAASDPDALRVIEDRCREVGATGRRLGEDLAIERRELALGGQRLAIRVGEQRYPDLFLPLYGELLATDAALAVAAVAALLGDRPLEREVVEEAFAGIRLPGRVEVAGHRPLLLLDGAHNLAAARALARAVRESFVWDRLVLVAGMMADKDVEGVLGTLGSLADEALVTAVDWPRAAPPERLRDALATVGVPTAQAEDVEGALARAVASAGAGGCVLVTGSLYTVGRARGALAARA